MDGDLNQMRRKLDEVKKKLAVSLKENKELKSLCLWSARRLPHPQYKDFAYGELEKITGQKHERL